MVLGIINSLVTLQADESFPKFKLLKTAVHVQYHTKSRITVCFVLKSFCNYHYHSVIIINISFVIIHIIIPFIYTCVYLLDVSTAVIRPRRQKHCLQLVIQFFN